MRPLPPHLLALTPGTLRAPRRGFEEPLVAALERAVHTACAAGVTGILFREPFLPDGLFLAAAERVASAARAAGAVWFGIHDRLHLASAVGADGVHLAGTSLPPDVARSVVGESVAMGTSAHTAEELVAAAELDYSFFSPVFRPSSKGGDERDVVGVDGLRQALGASARPVWALGGLTGDSIAELGPASAMPRLGGVAVIGGLWATDQTPIDGQLRSRLLDTAGIEERASALVAAVSRIFGA